MDVAPSGPATTREFMLGEGAGTGGGTQPMQLGVGPQHPAMHGIIRITTELDGEVIRKADVEIGYLHRAFEKDCEVGSWNNAIPYTDRLNYVSPLINNFAYASAVEKILGIEVTERCNYIRTIMSEISRICDHLTCVGASAMELGAFTVFLYMIKAREFLWELVEAVTGARLTISYGRVGGVQADLPDRFAAQAKKAFAETRVGPAGRWTPSPPGRSTSITRAARSIPRCTSTRASRARPKVCCSSPSRSRRTSRGRGVTRRSASTSGTSAWCCRRRRPRTAQSKA